MRLDGKRIIVTGGAKGIAAACVIGYIKAGATVAFCDIDDAAAEEMLAKLAEIEGSEGKYYYQHCNVANREEVDDFFEKADEFMGGLDVLAHVAGTDMSMPATDWREKEIDRIISVNLVGTIWTNQAAYRIFRRRNIEGSILNYASDTAYCGFHNGAVYAASKGGVISWTRAITLDWGHEGRIRCNCINPAIKTPLYQAWLDNADPAVVEELVSSYDTKYPCHGDMGDAETDLVPYMIFLASDGARFITGQVIGINGGLTFSR